MAKTRKPINDEVNEGLDRPIIIKLVDSPFEVTAAMMDNYDRIVVRGSNDKKSLQALENRFQYLSDGEIKFGVVVYETDQGKPYVDCRRVA